MQLLVNVGNNWYNAAASNQEFDQKELTCIKNCQKRLHLGNLIKTKCSFVYGCHE